MGSISIFSKKKRVKQGNLPSLTRKIRYTCKRVSNPSLYQDFDLTPQPIAFVMLGSGSFPESNAFTAFSR
jgi:hypothetical protein